MLFRWREDNSTTDYTFIVKLKYVDNVVHEEAFKNYKINRGTTNERKLHRVPVTRVKINPRAQTSLYLR